MTGVFNKKFMKDLRNITLLPGGRHVEKHTHPEDDVQKQLCIQKFTRVHDVHACLCSESLR